MAEKKEESGVTLTPYDLKRVKEVQNRMEKSQAEFGQIGLIKHQLSLREEDAKKYYTEALQLQQNVVQEIEEKYGKGVVDIETGEFTPDK